jgi:DNA-binding NarL/FixJ family response regulator
MVWALRAEPPATPAPAAETGLTPREQQVLACLARGHSDKKIAQELGISAGTVSKHVTSMLHKLELHNRVELARWAARGHLIQS